MALAVSPRNRIDDMLAGEEYAYGLDLTGELNTKTVSSFTYKIYDSSNVEVTDTLGGGSSIESGVITFGIKAVSVGEYTLQFIVTCIELLPDGMTPYEFYVELTLTVE